MCGFPIWPLAQLVFHSPLIGQTAAAKESPVSDQHPLCTCSLPLAPARDRETFPGAFVCRNTCQGLWHRRCAIPPARRRRYGGGGGAPAVPIGVHDGLSTSVTNSFGCG